MKWVAREHVGVDRMGCAWLICKLLDTSPAFVFVPKGAESLPGEAGRLTSLAGASPIVRGIRPSIRCCASIA
jgi:hypothetical protein